VNNSEKIGLGAAVVIGINAMIGAGIIAIPSMLSSHVGPAGIFSYLFAVFFAICIVLSLGHLASLHPGRGWSYMYPSLWGGHGLGMFSATLYLVGVVVAMGFLVQQAGEWFYVLSPVASPQTLGTIILALLTILVLAGAEASAITQYIIAGCVIIPLIIVSMVCWGNMNVEYFTPFMPKGFSAVLNMVPIAMFSLLGFESIASLYSVVREPKKNVPRAAVIAIVCVGSLYIFFASGVLAAIPAHYLDSGDVLAHIFQKTFPSYTYIFTLITVAAVFAIIGTLHSMIWSISALFSDVLSQAKSSTITYMLEQKIWNKRVSVCVTALGMLLVSFLFHADEILQLTALCIVSSYVLAISLLFFKRDEWRSGRNIIPLIGALGSFLMLYVSGGTLVELAAKMMTIFTH
jgi:APA family basic amino acid/polyamine antiporter